MTTAEIGTRRADIRQALTDFKSWDRCPVCDAVGGEFCTEEDGQTVLDHWGRPTFQFGKVDDVAAGPVAA